MRRRPPIVLASRASAFTRKRVDKPYRSLSISFAKSCVCLLNFDSKTFYGLYDQYVVDFYIPGMSCLVIVSIRYYFPRDLDIF